MNPTTSISIRESLLQELKALKAQLNSNKYGKKALVTFFCQLDNETHPKTKSAYQCQICARYMCIDCYEKLKLVRLPNCPFCEGELYKAQ
ncbi:MAG: hypothetical protein ACXADY_02720 [Candidatus Hodarchaeales archaeon]|jgi:hypothetical protein